MLLSLAYILIIGFVLSGIFQKLHLPGFIGMLITGVVLGPNVLNLIDINILNISADLREIALVVILLRAGLTLNLKELKSVGRPAALMCFLPATFEIIAVVILAPLLLGVSYVEAAIIGAMLAAVSPAVIVPKMIAIMEKGYGLDKNVPQIVLAGATADDVYAIVLFTTFLGMYSSGSFEWMSLVKIPLSIITGVAAGFIIGYLLALVFRKLHIRDTIKVFLILGACFVFVGVEEHISHYMPFSGLLAVMALGVSILKFREVAAKRIAVKFSKVWVAAEVVLFVLVGAAVDIKYIYISGIAAMLVILGALIVRTAGVLLSLIKSGLNLKEQFFCSIAYIPKATVQAAVGAIPLALGVASGNIILSVAVLSIIITAPLGAILIDLTYKKMLQPPKLAEVEADSK
ncbi:MAG: sodium:proton antiporter [Clostridia bacterium]|nr:sodium:proton antiporter [Clostridia bacterium]